MRRLTMTPFRSIRAAIAAAKRLANRTRRPVTVIVDEEDVRTTLPGVPVATGPGWQDEWAKLIRRNPRRRRRAPRRLRH